MKNKIILTLLLIGLLTACGSQATATPASVPTEEPAQPTEQPATSAPAATDTSAPEASPVPPTSTPTTASQGPTTVSYSADFGPLLTSRCGSCHGGGRREEGLSVTSYTDLLKGSDNGPVIIPGSADDSLLVSLVVSQEMPKRGPKLTPDQTQLIITWVNEGAQDN
jgi:mono/diheme cytochrome c family protein